MRYNKDWLLGHIKTNNVKYTSFFTGRDFMSNFYKREIKYNYKGVDYILSCSEHLFMVLKSIYFEHEPSVMKLLTMGDQHPMVYKKVGRNLPNYNKYGTSWEVDKDRVMYDSVKAKFTQNKSLKEQLINTGNNVLIEASPYDKYWGAGVGKGNEDLYNPKKWLGENRLGFILMELREDLREL